MKILLFILLPFLAHAQTPEIKIGRCAGKDPILLWGGGGPDFVEFTLIVGEGPCDGGYFKIYYTDAESILCIKSYWSIDSGKETWKAEFLSDKHGDFTGIGTFHNMKKGDAIHFRYIVTRKKEPRT